MPPKKSETPAVVDLPDQPPTFDNDAFMEDLLQKAKFRNVAGLEAGVAQALGTEDYKTRLQQGIVVDFVVECILFASQNSFGPRKTASFIKWMNEMRVSIETTGSVEGAKVIFKNHLVSHAERSGGSDGLSPLPTLADEQPAAGAAKPAAPGRKGEGKKGTKGDETAAKPQVDTNVFIAVGEMGQVSEFIVTGLLQHWQLYHFAATLPDPPAETTTFNLTLQAPMRGPPLVRAITQEQFDQQCEDKRKAAEAELVRLRHEEEAAIEAKRLEDERKERERLQEEEEIRLNTLYFDKVGTERCVAKLQQDMEKEMQERQRVLLERIAKLEDLLHVQA